MKYNIFIFSFLVLIISINTAISNNNYIINDDTVYIDDSKVYLSANPHTLSSSGWVYFNLASKVYTGNIDACWGFNTSVSKPTKAEVYSPYWVNTTTNHKKTFYNSTFYVYTGNNLDYGNSYNINYKYTITESVISDNGTTYIISNAAFDSFDTDGINYTIYWYTRHDNHYLWKDFSSSFNSVIHDYKGYNKWYYIKNVPISSNKEYTVRAWIDVPVSTKKQSGKYYFAIKPSYETIVEAVNNGHFYNLDPWWNATWSNRKNITLTGNTSGAQTDYQLLLNVTYNSNMQPDFDDLRFCNETHELDAWLESKVDNSYALVWVEFPTTPPSGFNQTYYMYYGNVGAASNWDGVATFNFFDDFYRSNSGTVGNGWTEDSNTGGGNASIESNMLKLYTPDTGSDSIVRVVRDLTSLSLAQFIIESKMKIIAIVSTDNNRNLFGTFDGDGTNNVFIGSGYIASQLTGLANYGKDDTYHDYGLAPSIDTWQKLKLTYDTTNEFIPYFNDSAEAALTGRPLYSNPFKLFFYQLTSAYGAGTGTLTSYYDYTFVRKYAASPPTYQFGSEEYPIPEGPTTLIEEMGLIMSEITTGLKSINMGNYLVYAFILIGILLIILGIQIITNNIYRG